MSSYKRWMGEPISGAEACRFLMKIAEDRKKDIDPPQSLEEELKRQERIQHRATCEKRLLKITGDPRRSVPYLRGRSQWD